MKKPLVILLIALVAGLVSFGITRSRCTTHDGSTLLDGLPELDWLRTELALSDSQLARIGELHAAYRPVCEEMCRRIDESRTRLETAALNSRSSNSDLQQTAAEYERVRTECKLKMLEHLYQTAALMDETQAERYLKAVVPAALGTPRGGHTHH